MSKASDYLAAKAATEAPVVEAPVVETTTEETTTEAPTEAPIENAEPTKIVDPFDNKFAALSRKEKAIREKEQSLKEMEVKVKEWEELQALKDSDLIGYAEKIGLNYEKLTEAIINGPANNEEIRKVNSLEQRIAKFEDAEKSRQQQAEQENLQNELAEYVKKLNDHIDTAEDKYELIRATKSHQMVVDTIGAYWKQNSEELDWDTAAQLVEDHLWESEIDKSKRILLINKAREKLGLDQVLAEETDELNVTTKTEVKPKSKPKVREVPKTLSNSNTSSAPERVLNVGLSKEERRKNAIALLREKNRK